MDEDHPASGFSHRRNMVGFFPKNCAKTYSIEKVFWFHITVALPTRERNHDQSEPPVHSTGSTAWGLTVDHHCEDADLSILAPDVHSPATTRQLVW
jgi:hypothetical protein